MDDLHDRISRNVSEVKRRMREAADRAGRNIDRIQLIPVTKTVGRREIHILHELGFPAVAESRVESAVEKKPGLPANLEWHMVGTIQRRKVPSVVEAFDHVDSVDRWVLAEALERECTKVERRLPILAQVNVSGETSKHGVPPEELPALIEKLGECQYLRLEGLMTMAPLVPDPEEVRPVFARLREIAGSFGLKRISMGMTNDFEVAIEEGATEVRIGTALFK